MSTRLLFIYLLKKTGKRGFKTRFRIISIIECFINLIYVFAFFLLLRYYFLIIYKVFLALIHLLYKNSLRTKYYRLKDRQVDCRTGELLGYNKLNQRSIKVNLMEERKVWYLGRYNLIFI